MHNGVAPVKLEAAHLLFALIRTEPNSQKRGELCGRIIVDFSQARSCLDREFFQELASVVPKLFSLSWTKKHFFSAFLSLHSDPIPAVRRRSAVLLPELCEMAPAEVFWQVRPKP